MVHPIQLIAERAEKSAEKQDELLTLLYNLHLELSGTTDDFCEITSFVLAADRAAKTGEPNLVPLPAGWQFTQGGQEFEKSEEAVWLIQELYSRLEPAIPYADTIQKTPLPEVETILIFLGNRYGLFAEPVALRQIWLGLQERVNEYDCAANRAEKLVEISRLQHGITWLKDYEEQLATYLKQRDNTPAQSLDTPAPSAPWPEQAPAAAEAGAPTVGDLCCNERGFTPAYLNKLLASLDVLTETLTPAGPTYCLSGSLIGKGAVRISKTFAALTELREIGLFDLSGNWQAAMKAPPYGLTFGKKVLNYEYKSKNSRNRSDTFDLAIGQTRRWLGRWQAAYNNQKRP